MPAANKKAGCMSASDIPPPFFRKYAAASDMAARFYARVRSQSVQRTAFARSA